MPILGSQKGDVYAFGIIVHEIMCRGQPFGVTLDMDPMCEENLWHTRTCLKTLFALSAYIFISSLYCHTYMYIYVYTYMYAHMYICIHAKKHFVMVFS